MTLEGIRVVDLSLYLPGPVMTPRTRCTTWSGGLPSATEAFT
jgi:hypothetical protein